MGKTIFSSDCVAVNNNIINYFSWEITFSLFFVARTDSSISVASALGVTFQ